MREQYKYSLWTPCKTLQYRKVFANAMVEETGIPALAVGSVKKLLSEDHQLSAVKLAEKIGVASRNIENNIKKLKEYGILIRHGSPKNGYWEIVDKDLQE